MNEVKPLDDKEVIKLLQEKEAIRIELTRKLRNVNIEIMMLRRCKASGKYEFLPSGVSISRKERRKRSRT